MTQKNQAPGNSLEGKKEIIVALDQGTTSSRTLAFSLNGKVLASSQREFLSSFPRPGWVEQDPEDIFNSQLRTLQECLKKLGNDAERVACVGLTNQRETTILWDRKTGKPIYKAIVWQDRRSASLCEEWRKIPNAESRLQEINGLLFDSYFSGGKIRWLLDHVPQARERAEAGELAFGTVDSYLCYRFTKGRKHITDVTNASRSMLFNLRTCDWDQELLDFFRIPRSLLPQIVSSSGKLAEIDSEYTQRTLPICGIAGDQQAALFGQRCFAPGDAKVTYGTGAFLLANLGTEPKISKHKLLTTVAWRLGDAPPTYAFEGAVFVAGSLIQWLRDELGLIESVAEIEQLARSCQDNGGVYFVPAFTGLGAPYWDSYAQGQLMGLTRGTTKAQIARAALEGIAHQVTDAFYAMQEIELRQVRVDGGAAKNRLLMQIQANQLEKQVLRPQNTETTAWGAALLAGLGHGIFHNLSEIEALPEESDAFQPDGSDMAKERAMWKRAVQRTSHFLSDES